MKSRTSFAILGICVALVTVAPAQTYTTLVSFDVTNGAVPNYGSLVQGLDGNLYGTTESGGTGTCFGGCGTVYRMTPGGTLTTIYDFCSQTGCSDGYYPESGLVLATNGNFYGTTADGGSNAHGTAFEITPSGKLTTLYTFCSLANCADGSGPGTLVQALNGNFYGTTSGGGNTNTNCPAECGTVFEMTSNGKLTTLYDFCSQTNCADGDFPFGGLVQAVNGNFYGTTLQGGAGAGAACLGCGTIFEITPAGKLTTLYNFCSQTNCTDGFNPEAGLVQASNLDFYGTTNFGGANGFGEVFEITREGKFSVIYSFCGQANCADGDEPIAGLVQATNGFLYGTTYYGGAHSSGTLFQLTPSGTLTTLYSFCAQTNCTDGSSPIAGIMQATNGTLYSTTSTGGTDTTDCAFGCGTVFSEAVGLGPFVTFVHGAGRVGQTVEILGQGFSKGVDSVSFNGTQANFTVGRDTFLAATVPVGATTGYVTVSSASQTLTSNVQFLVIP